MSATTARRVRTVTAGVWIFILAFTGGFQFFRGELVDGFVFSAVAIALLADAAGLLRGIPFRRWMPPRPLLLASAVIAAAVLALSPRHSLADGIVVAAAGVVALVVAWPPHAEDDADGTEPSQGWSPRLHRTAALWSAVLLAVALWELAMYLLGTFEVGGRDAFPALSDLLDPLVENPLGRVLFVVGWLLGGVGLASRGFTVRGLTVGGLPAERSDT